jgi:hypothetical protein
MSTSSTRKLPALLRVLADGREHTAEELLRTPKLRGVSRTLPRVYISRLRAEGHFIVLLPGIPHAYQLLPPAAQSQTNVPALDRALRAKVEPKPVRTKREIALDAGFPLAAVEASA